ncbi:MAG: DUF4340 domain-containing protein [Myxococcota bacterium]
MNTVNKVLVGALGVQAALALITNWPSGGSNEPRDLLGFPVDQIASIEVTGRKGRDEVPLDPLKLSRTEAGWVISSAEDYPADDKLVAPLVESLGKFKVRAPIATTESSRVNLEVADDAFTRFLVVTSKDGQARKLFVGAGQGKSSHVRVEGESEIYDLADVSAWGLAETANRYFDRDFLKTDLSTVTAVSVQRPGQPPISLTKAEGQWTLDGLAVGAALDQTAATTFVSSLVNVRMLEPAGRTVKPEMGFDGPGATVVTWSATPAESTPDAPAGAGTTLSYRVGADIPNKSGRAYLKSETSPFVLEVMKTNVSSALDKPVEKLFVGAEPDRAPAPPPGGMPGGMPGMPPGGGPGHGRPPGH